MSKEVKDFVLVLLVANIPTIGLLVLSGWFAYLENGYWGWPFVASLFTAYGIKTSKDKFEEEKERDEAKAEALKKYGYNIYEK